MSVASIASRTMSLSVQALSVQAPTVQAPTVQLAFVVTVAGATRHRDALDIIDGVHHLIDLSGTATVTVLPVADERAATPPPVSRSGVSVFPSSRSVSTGDRSVPLTRIEFDLLLFLAEHPRRVFTRAQLLDEVWDLRQTGGRTVDVHIRRLRATLGSDLITTVHGVGYRLAEGADITIIREP